MSTGVGVGKERRSSFIQLACRRCAALESHWYDVMPCFSNKGKSTSFAGKAAVKDAVRAQTHIGWIRKRLVLMTAVPFFIPTSTSRPDEGCPACARIPSCVLLPENHSPGVSVGRARVWAALPGIEVAVRCAQLCLTCVCVDLQRPRFNHSSVLH